MKVNTANLCYRLILLNLKSIFQDPFKVGNNCHLLLAS